MIGQSPAFRVAQALIEKIAQFDAPVLIEGETGTGKELAARAIHYGGARRNGPFVPVNCGAIPDALIENELFGHHRGAFTDARSDHLGLVELAHDGTLFLDELDDVGPDPVTLAGDGLHRQSSDGRCRAEPQNAPSGVPNHPFG